MNSPQAWARRLVPLLVLPLLFLLPLEQALAQFRLRCDAVSALGGPSSSASHNLLAIAGQPHPIETSSSAAHILRPGFIPCIAEASTSVTPPPPSWAFVSPTSSSGTIAVPFAINPTIGTQALRNGDAVGVFFDRGGSLICAGNSLWQVGQNMAITAWGDDSSTPLKDGFAEGELIRYKIWDAYAAREYEAVVAYSSGGPNYAANGIYVLSSLTAATTASHNLALAQSWNMISSYIAPTDPALEVMLASIIPNMEIMKNNAGQVFWPRFGINTIGNWNVRDGYQINMNTPAPLTITGAQVVPEATPIALASGWNLAAYLRNSPMSIVTALANISSALVIVKNNAGQVYWPIFGINQIGDMLPGQGYQINVSAAATLTYPPNLAAASNANAAKSRSEKREGFDFETPHHYSSVRANTGANATVLIEARGLNEGDEIAVRGADQKVIGSGVVRAGKALLTIWGDNEVAGQKNEGARTGGTLLLEAWSAAEQKTKTLALTNVTDALSGAVVQNTLQYQTDAVLLASVAEAEQIPGAFSLAQNYPNPFNPSTLIKYNLPHDVHVMLEVYDVLGRRVAVLVDATKKAGYHEVVFENASLSSGVYFYRLQAGAFQRTMKMALMR